MTTIKKNLILALLGANNISHNYEDPTFAQTQELLNVDKQRLKAMLLFANKRIFEAKTQLDIPEQEKLTWEQQRQEARAYKKDNTAPTPLLTILSQKRGLTLNALATKVLAKADAYEQLIANALADKHALEDWIEAI